MARLDNLAFALATGGYVLLGIVVRAPPEPPAQVSALFQAGTPLGPQHVVRIKRTT
jgi:hypothetical protein